MLHQYQETLTVSTQGRKSYEITDQIRRIVQKSSVYSGLCHLFVQHTSASLIISENADPDVHYDLETLMTRLAPDGDPAYRHTAEGIDDMSAHMRSILTQTSLSVPVSDYRCLLGTWQGIYLWEHRSGAFQRRIIVTVQGEADIG